MAKVYIQFLVMITAGMQLASSMRLMPHEDTEKTPRKKRNFENLIKSERGFEMFSMMDFPHKSLQKYALDPVQSLLYSKKDLGHINGILTDRDIIEPMPGTDKKKTEAKPTRNKLTSNDALGFQKIRNHHKNMENVVERSKQQGILGSPNEVQKVSYPKANEEPLPESTTSNSLPQRQNKAGEKSLKGKIAHPVRPLAMVNRQQSTKTPIARATKRPQLITKFKGPRLWDARRNFATNRKRFPIKRRKTKRPSAFDFFFFKDAFDFGARALAKKLLHIDDSTTGEINNETTPELIERLMDEENKRIDCVDENKDESKTAANDRTKNTQEDATTTKIVPATRSLALKVSKKDNKTLPDRESANRDEQDQKKRQHESKKGKDLKEKLKKVINEQEVETVQMKNVINEQEVESVHTQQPTFPPKGNDGSLRQKLSQKSQLRDSLSLQNEIESEIESEDATANARQRFEDMEKLNVVEEDDLIDPTNQPPPIHQTKVTSIPKLKTTQNQTTEEATTVLSTTEEITITMPTTVKTTTRMPTTKRMTTTSRTTTRRTTRVTTTKPKTTSLPTTVAAPSTTVAPTTELTTTELTTTVVPTTKKRTTTAVVPNINSRALNSKKRSRRRKIRTFKTPDWLLPPFGYRRPCPTRADAMFRSQRNKVYVIDGNMAYIIGRYGIESGPMHLRYLWSSAIGQVYDGFFRMYDHSTVLFYGNKYAVFARDMELTSGGEKDISTLGLPKEALPIDAVSIWPGNEKTYYFKGAYYWRYNEYENRADYGYPRPIKKYWPGVPDNVDTAFVAPNNHLYFIKDGLVYKMNYYRPTVQYRYPRKLSESCYEFFS